MNIYLYSHPFSVSCRAVQMTAQILGVHLQIKEVDVFDSDVEEKDVELLAVNPNYTVPTLVDKGFVLTETTAIVIYLFEKYGKDEKLYPKDLQTRSQINEILCFNQYLSQNFSDYWYLQVINRKVADKLRVKSISAAIKRLDNLLKGRPWIVGDYMTIADIALVVTVSSVDAFDIKLDNCPNILTWYRKCQTCVPGYDMNQAALDKFKVFNKKNSGITALK